MSDLDRIQSDFNGDLSAAVERALDRGLDLDSIRAEAEWVLENWEEDHND